MPQIKGKPRKLARMYCRAKVRGGDRCGSTDFRFERGTNSRIIHGKKRVVVNAICAVCGTDHLSYHPDALLGAKLADQQGTKSVTTAQVTKVIEERAARGADPYDVDSTEPKPR